MVFFLEFRDLKLSVPETGTPHQQARQWHLNTVNSNLAMSNLFADGYFMYSRLYIRPFSPLSVCLLGFDGAVSMNES